MTVAESARISLLADLVEQRVRRYGADTGFSVYIEFAIDGSRFMQIVIHQPSRYTPVNGRIEMGVTPWGQCNYRPVATELRTRRALAIGRAEGMRNVEWLAFWNP